MRSVAILTATLALLTTVGAARGDEPSDERIMIGLRTVVSPSAGYQGPLGPAAGLDLLVGLGADVEADEDRVKAIAGALFGIQAGTEAGKLSLGAGASARIQSDDFHGMAAAALKASLVRTWSDAPGAKHGTYLGPELDLTLWHVNTSIGVLGRVAGSGSRAMFAWGIGLRF